MLGCSRPTIYAHIQKSPRLARIFEEIKEDFECEILDTAEAALLLAITNGEPWAIKKALDSKGKQRGWGDTAQVEVAGTLLHQVEVAFVDDWNGQKNNLPAQATDLPTADPDERRAI